MMLESLPLLGLGGVVVLTAAAVLFLLVQNELAPAGGLTRRGKLLLAGALGMGIVAFASKLFALWIFERYPEASIRPLLAWEILRPAQARPAAVPPQRGPPERRLHLASTAGDRSGARRQSALRRGDRPGPTPVPRHGAIAGR